MSAEPTALPLIVQADDGLLLFRSVQAARGYLEVPDVEAGVYRAAYDADGRLVSITAPEELFEARPDGAMRRMRWRLAPAHNPVDVTLAEDVPRHAEELRELLSGALGGRVGADESVRMLVSKAVERFGMI